MANVAVVGAGVFGCVAAVHLSSLGHIVTIFESNSKILTGTSVHNTNRLHLGFHYPRDLPTALQSRLGYDDFRGAFPKAVNENFPNFYGLVGRGGRTNLSEFQKFLASSGLSPTELPVPDEVLRMGLDPAELLGFWNVKEAVVDLRILGEQLVVQLKDSNVAVKVLSPVERLERNPRGDWRVYHSMGVAEFDVVVKATYGTDRIHDGIDPKSSVKKRFEVTLTLEVDLGIPPFGLTLIDGDFLTILPKGFTTTAMVYAPGPSVVKRTEGHALDPDWAKVSNEKLRFARNNLLERLRFWLPGLPSPSIVRQLVGIRTLLSGVDRTDARPSAINLLGPNYYEIWAGKIDHSVSIARELGLAIGSEKDVKSSNPQ